MNLNLIENFQENGTIQNIIIDLQKKKGLIELGEIEDFSGSDSDPSGDELDEETMNKIMPHKGKKKKRKDKK